MVDVRFGSKSRHLQCKTACPLYPRKQTSAGRSASVALPDVITSHPHSGRCCAGKVFTFTPSVQFADVHGGRSNLRQPDFTA
jgi:hypothetical protein